MATNDARGIAPAFSTAVVKGLAEPGRYPFLIAMDKLQPLLALVDTDRTLADAFDAGYALIQRQYRSEYVYKNAIVSKMIFGRHSPHTANALLEMPVRFSIADLVMITDTATVYEIKTDFDSFQRLELQLFSYSSCFEHVYVVTSEERANAAIDKLPGHVGLMALRRSGALTVKRQAQGGYDRIELDALNALLHQDEKLAILHRQLGYTADVPNGRLWGRLGELFLSLPPEVCYDEFVTELRKRHRKQLTHALAADLPASLRSTIYGTRLSGIGWRRLSHVLHQPVSAFRRGGQYFYERNRCSC